MVKIASREIRRPYVPSSRESRAQHENEEVSSREAYENRVHL